MSEVDRAAWGPRFERVRLAQGSRAIDWRKGRPGGIWLVERGCLSVHTIWLDKGNSKPPYWASWLVVKGGALCTDCVPDGVALEAWAEDGTELLYLPDDRFTQAALDDPGFMDWVVLICQAQQATAYLAAMRMLGQDAESKMTHMLRDWARHLGQPHKDGVIIEDAPRKRMARVAGCAESVFGRFLNSLEEHALLKRDAGRDLILAESFLE